MHAITCGSDQRKDFLNSPNVMSENWFRATAGRETTLSTFFFKFLKNIYTKQMQKQAGPTCE